jgi:hypothetical protein
MFAVLVLCKLSFTAIKPHWSNANPVSFNLPKNKQNETIRPLNLNPWTPTTPVNLQRTSLASPPKCTKHIRQIQSWCRAP